jgi:hypothetical protein
MRVEARADRILSDVSAAAAFAGFVEAQLRYRRMRANALARLRGLVRLLAIVAVAFFCAGIVPGAAASPPPAAQTVPGSGQ